MESNQIFFNTACTHCSFSVHLISFANTLLKIMLDLSGRELWQIQYCFPDERISKPIKSALSNSILLTNSKHKKVTKNTINLLYNSLVKSLFVRAFIYKKYSWHSIFNVLIENYFNNCTNYDNERE